MTNGAVPMSFEDEPSVIPDFDAKLMNEALDSSEAAYHAVLEKHKVDEEERARRKDEMLKSRSIFRKVVDTLIPV